MNFLCYRAEVNCASPNNDFATEQTLQRAFGKPIGAEFRYRETTIISSDQFCYKSDCNAFVAHRNEANTMF